MREKEEERKATEIRLELYHKKKVGRINLKLHDNPNLPQAIAEFDETISFLFDPPEESV